MMTIAKELKGITRECGADMPGAVKRWVRGQISSYSAELKNLAMLGTSRATIQPPQTVCIGELSDEDLEAVSEELSTEFGMFVRVYYHHNFGIRYYTIFLNWEERENTENA